MDLTDKIWGIAETNLKDGSHFIVDIAITQTKGPKKIRVFVDGDEGITIDDCADLSRAMANQIEEEDLMDIAYTLEVSSPGIDFPLSSVRQYQKNIGRLVRVTLLDGKDLKGILKSVNDNAIVLDKDSKKGKKKEDLEETIPHEDIKKTIVQISFK